MSSYDPLLTAAFAVLGAIIGLIVRWRLATLAYRRDDEVTQPFPGPRWWVPAAVAAASGLLAWRFGLDRWPLLLPTLPLAWFGPWLSAIDLDVRRLPNRLLAAHAGFVAAGVGAAALITDAPMIAIQAALGGAVAFAVFWILDRLRPGGFGWGDGKYVPIIGAATAAVSLSVAWWAFLIACVAAVGATPFRRRRANFPFGPWLAAGALVAISLLG
ncbi:prepilin peptidase [Propioniciclava sp. MC1595]|uniref:prepilin peptidase n=1 Tax=Propioniciclava sp. MC1595 TaxID=2760308 RepID=UPI00166289A7|nr:A24 family peptidase [Propioniciclava sp. MC1595]MBB1496103.1 prepilin peptidase [Propioniciclava sp. MC1595]QTE26652.1 prepilin peptidase [Propioniciclava sp. MC1595]